MEMRKGVVSAYYPPSHTADVQLVGSMPTVVKSVPVAEHVSPELVTVGSWCAVGFFEGDPGVVLATWGSVPSGWVTADLLRDAAVGEGHLGFNPLLDTDFEARGDLLAGRGSGLYGRLAVGCDGEVLTADSAEGLGARWASPGGGGVPSGLIAVFDAECPSGWTRVSAFDGRFVRGAAAYGATGGASTHTHTVDIWASNKSGTILSEGKVSRDYIASTTGLWAWYSNQVSNEQSRGKRETTSGPSSGLPPYVDVVFCKKD
jgi:hypothetical protein